MEKDWDKKLSGKLREIGLTTEQIGAVIGIVAEERMRADLQGFERGYNSGSHDALTKKNIH